MPTTTFWERWLGYDWLVFLPCFSFNVKRVDVVVSNSLVVYTTVSTVNVDLAVVVASSRVCSWWWSSNRGFLVVETSFIPKNAGECVVADFEPPSVIQSLSRGGMATENEHAIKLGRSNSNMLSSCRWEVFTLRFLLFPAAFLYNYRLN